ncbi:BatA and WFA domain-containing protein [Candidatus Sumerlaeota bacterium]|nr:BatA and WFA domain-containing protein [Candidatus Sumerlaeota bacterium]
MPLAFFAPIFFAGAGLIAMPWIIHQIRRPEREPLRFSSLMFIPIVKKEIIERRRIQHILLMLLRMLLFLLLVLAFTRPYWKVPAAEGGGAGPARHIILLDTSYSMGTLDYFSQAKRRALSIVSSLLPEEKVGVIAFARSPRVLSALLDTEDRDAGSKDRAADAIELVTLSQEGTAYLPALELAQEILLSVERTRDEDAPPNRLVVHLISDFQMRGMPRNASGWRLSPLIALDSVAIGGDAPDNYSVMDLAVRETSEGDIRVLSKVKNWSTSSERPTEVKLVVNGAEMARETISVKPRNASQVSFRFTPDGERMIEGWLETATDALEIDNRRYFVWSPPRQRNVLLIADDPPEQQWPAEFFLTRAIPSSKDLPWRLQITSQEDLQAELASRGGLPDLILAGALNSLESRTAGILLDFARNGGRVLIMLNGTMDAETLNQDLLSDLGLVSGGFRFPAPRSSRFDLLSWLDFDHPIFAPFGGSRFNDFSPIRFFNYHELTLLDEEQDPGAGPAPKILAKFEGPATSPGLAAMVEIRMDEGRILLWAFGVDLFNETDKVEARGWTNLAKNIKFQPLLHETLAYLTGIDEVRRSWTIGEDYGNLPSVSGGVGAWTVQAPGEEARTMDGDELTAFGRQPLSATGFIRWRGSAESQWEQVDAVNLDADESDPERISVEEFELKLSSVPITSQMAASNDLDQGSLQAGFVVRSEYWRVLLGLLFAFLVLESWYAARLIR